MREVTLGTKDDRSYNRVLVPKVNLGGLPYKTDKTDKQQHPFKQTQAKSESNLASWAGPDEISEILDFFAVPPLRPAKVSKSSPTFRGGHSQGHSPYSSDNSRGCSFDSDRAVEPIRTAGGIYA